MVAPSTIADLWNEPPEMFAQRLTIENLYNQRQVLSPLFLEQVAYVKAMARSTRIIAIKPRQVGFTTAAVLFLFAKTYRSRDPRQALVTVNTPATLNRVRRMIDVAYTGLPRELRGGAKVNAERTAFLHNGAVIHRLVAGKADEGRSGTYNDLLFTEMAFYKARSSGKANADEDSDASLFSSLQATLHDPLGHLIVESTGDGPKGQFHKLVQEAPTLDGVEFVFLPWSVSPRYRVPVPVGWQRTDAEDALARAHGLDDGQLAWRRMKLTLQGYSELRFRREYPLTAMDPFLLDESAWFAQLALDGMAGLARVDRPTLDNGVTVYLPFIPGRQYFIGADTSGGVRKDEFVLHVLRDDLEHCATFASSSLKEEEQALMVSRVAAMFGGALCLIEANNFGAKVNELCHALGVALWRNEKREWWYANRERKRELMLHARAMIDGSLTRVKDLHTILQLQLIVEKSNGRVEARGDGHDDRGIAYCLALWCAKRYSGRREAYDPDEVRQQQYADAKREFERTWGR